MTNQCVLLISLSRPTAWQPSSTAVYGPFPNALDPRIDVLVGQVHDDLNATATLMPLTTPPDLEGNTGAHVPH